MRKLIRMTISSVMLYLMMGCSTQLAKPTLTTEPLISPVTQYADQTLTPGIMADFYFSACAFLDANDNEMWDESDTPIEGAQMGLSLDGGQTFALGDLTRSDGCAQVWAPGGNIKAPFTIRMNSPEGSNLTLVGESQIVYEDGPNPRFLFREP
jgi:hypothetical protein